eukprot:gnl/Dysnectes_brevis/1920_a2205_997.p1 GENE.gnl/Dysnectes_brevis/1920_a2205_997~~gnl/Dysnectes_brevis/1920_a2205_997.p1  ORF type:complete len:850 (-),score=281.07 gnl/Dysnectes_brevis/1920_a2205_997:59-2446(-)
MQNTFSRLDRFRSLQPNFIDQLVNREETITRTIQSLGFQFLLHNDRRMAPLPALFGGPGIGKTSLALFLFTKVCSHPHLFHNIQRIIQHTSSELWDIVRGILYLHLSGRELFFIACTDISSGSDLPSAIIMETNAHIEKVPGAIKATLPSPTTPLEHCSACLDAAEASVVHLLQAGLPNARDVSPHVLAALPKTDDEARQLLGLGPGPLPFLMTLDEIDKLSPPDAKGLLLLLQGLIATRRLMVTVAGNLGKVVESIAAQSSIRLDHIRLNPILHPQHVRALAAAAGVHRGHPGCKLYCPRTKMVTLGPESWNLFIGYNFQSAGIPVILSYLARAVYNEAKRAAKTYAANQDNPLIHLHAVQTASFAAVPADLRQRYKPTAFYRALALASVPLLPGLDRLPSPVTGELEYVANLEEQGLIYLADYIHSESTSSMSGPSIVSEEPSAREDDTGMSPAPVGTDLLNSLLEINLKSQKGSRDKCTTSSRQTGPVSILCPAFLCSDLDPSVDLLADLPAWAGGLQSAMSPFSSELGLRCEQECAGLYASRLLLTSELTKSKDVQMWRVLPQGVNASGECVGAANPGHAFSSLLLCTPPVATAAQIVRRFDAAVHVLAHKEYGVLELTPTPPRQARRAWTALTEADDAHSSYFYLNGTSAQAPDCLCAAYSVADDQQQVVGWDIKTSRKPSFLAKQWAQCAALGKLAGWEVPFYLVSVRARLTEPRAESFPSIRQYEGELVKIYGGLFSPEEVTELAQMALSRHILVGADFFGISWSHYLTAEKARSVSEDIFDIHDFHL